MTESSLGDRYRLPCVCAVRNGHDCSSKSTVHLDFDVPIATAGVFLAADRAREIDRSSAGLIG